MSWADSCDLEYALADLKAENERLQDENERLRSCLSDSAENAKQIMHEAHVQEAENEKLRELVRIAVKYCDSGTCDGCPIQGESGSCPYSDMARELGVDA